MQPRYRNEWKYPISNADAEELYTQLAAVLPRDTHAGADGRYRIHSLYFDDPFDRAARENDAGISHRQKFRIRRYGDVTDRLTLECKRKDEGRCRKESCPISLKEYQLLLAGRAQDVFWATETSLLKRFCARMLAEGLTPKAVIRYERTAFVETATNVRITLDESVTVSADTAGFLGDGGLCIPIQPLGTQLLEVKFDDVLAGSLRRLITKRGLIQTAYSKYALGRLQLQNMGNP